MAICQGYGTHDPAVEVDGEGAPRVRFPEPFNAAACYIDRHLALGRGSKLAIRTPTRDVTYAELVDQVNRFGNALRDLGVDQGERVLMLVDDQPEYFYLFWGAIKAGVIPVPLNTLLRARDFAFIIRDSECAGLFHAPRFAAEVEAALAQVPTRPRLVVPLHGGADSLTARAARASSTLQAIPSRADADCFWLYSSGTTGQPKGVVHAHGAMAVTSELYAMNILGARDDDVFFSVPRLYFSYGMGCAMTAPLWIGATAVLDDRRPTPQTVLEVLRRYSPTVFAAVPTFYIGLLAAGELTRADVPRLRRCICGGEPTPPELQRRWLDLTGVPIIEGIGSTEVLFIYISNRTDDLRPGATGTPVPGYQVRIVDATGRDVAGDAPGRLLVKGQSVMRRYWNNPAKTAEALVDGWFDTGDTYRRDADGYYVYCGRSDDMLKVGGRWVSPFEIESTLLEHPAVLEAAVVGRTDESGLVKAEAWVVLRDPASASDFLADEVRRFCKSRLAPYKYPRWVRFVDQFPKTATGKIQRYKLRASVPDLVGAAAATAGG